MRPGRDLFFISALLALGAAIFFTGIGWGLPSRAVDPFLFGARPVWSGREIVERAGPGEAAGDRAADVSAEPIARRDHAVVVNDADVQRARIVRRYRLMSYQPDEFTTFAALARMKPSKGDLDPRMYKYGGLWVYPLGGMLRIASLLRLVQLRADIGWYLDRPEAFGRFYVVARSYSAVWGLVGMVAVFMLVRRITSNTLAAFCAGLCFTFMPVVVNAAHEAKPHLAGAVLMLLAVLAAARFVDRGGRAAWLACALLCGAAIGMVLSALPILLVPPLMIWLRAREPASRSGAARRTAALCSGVGCAWAIASLVYLITNPYVGINVLRDPGVLRSNFGNSAGFYRASWIGAGLPNALLLTAVGTSLVLAAAGIIATVALGIRAIRMRDSVDEQERRRRAAGLLLAAPALAVAGQFALFAAGQPADYARFALPLDVFLAIEAIVAITTFMRGRGLQAASFILLILTTAWAGGVTLRGFVRDSSSLTGRVVAARELRQLCDGGARILASREEPAPWSLPPVDLFRWRIVLPPRSFPAGQAFPGADVTIGPADLPPGPQPKAVKLLNCAPFSWADKPFDLRQQR